MNDGITPERLCRTCLKEVESSLCTSLFFKSELNPSLTNAVIIMDIARVKLNQNDLYTKYICYNCIEKLYSAYEFKLNCEESNRLLEERGPKIYRWEVTMDACEDFNEKSVKSHKINENREKIKEIDGLKDDGFDDVLRVTENNSKTTKTKKRNQHLKKSPNKKILLNAMKKPRLLYNFNIRQKLPKITDKNTVNHRDITTEAKEVINQLFSQDNQIKPRRIIGALNEKRIIVPKNTFINHYLANLRKKNNHTKNPKPDALFNLKELQQFLQENSKIPDDETEFFVESYTLKSDEPSFFRFFVTSKILLKLGQNINHINFHMTNKLNWQGNPIMIIGTTDRCKQFHPLGITVSSNQTVEDFEFIFKALRNGFEKIFSGVFSPETIVTNSLKVSEAFKNVFGENSLAVTCWAHARKNCQRKLKEIVRPEENIKLILEDLDLLQLSQTEETFETVSKLFLEKWKDYQDFLSYFKSEWLEKYKNWYEGAAVLVPSTNNALEVFIKTIHDENTLRVRLPLVQILQAIKSHIDLWSKKYASGEKIFENVPLVNLELWAKSYHWASTNLNIALCESNDGTKFYKIKNNTTEKNNQFHDLDIENFDAYRNSFASVWLVVLPTDENLWINSTCDCPGFFKNMICKHVVGLAIHFQYVEPPSEAKIIAAGFKRKRGRPSKVQMMNQTDQ